MAIHFIIEHLNHVQTSVYERICGRGRAVANFYQTASANEEEFGIPISCSAAEGGLITPAEAYLGLLDKMDIALPEAKYLKIRTVSMEEIGRQYHLGLLTRAEALALWAYLRLSPGASSRLEELTHLTTLLQIPDEFDQRIVRDAREGSLTKFLGSRLSENADLELVEAINNIVIEQFNKEGAWCSEKVLTGLDPVVYQHEADRQLLGLMDRVPIMPKLMDAVSNTIKRNMEITVLANSLEVTPFSMPDVYTTYLKACERLCVENPPPLYIEQGPINAYTTGSTEKPMIVVTSMAVSMLDKHELTYILGHELGHAQNNHVSKKILANILSNGVVEYVPVVGPLLKMGAGLTLGPMLMAWNRRSELTADRAGLLACQNLEAALRANIKLGGMPFTHFATIKTRGVMQQVINFRRTINDGFLDRSLDILNAMSQSHPWMVWRVSSLVNWVASGGYAEIVEGTTGSRRAMAEGIRQDPTSYTIRSLVIDHVADYLQERFKLYPIESYPVLRRMIFAQQPPEAGSPMAAVLSVGMQVKKVKGGKMEYAVLVERAETRDGKLMAVTERMPFEYSDAWEDVPAALQREMINSGKMEIETTYYDVRKLK